jgi:exoribonuclease R
VGSGPALAKSLEKLGTGRKADIVKLIMTYCMQLAKYCSSDDSEGIGLHHFALNVPLYTHFTSPIRRYPDVIVHRTLDFILELERLGESPPPPEILPVSVAFAKDTLAKLRGMSATALVARIEESEEARMGRPDFLYTPEELEEICIRCNTKKWNAKKASDASNLVFFSYYLKTLLVRSPDKPYLEGQAYVVSMDCKKKVFNIFVPEYALDHAVTPADVEVQPWESLTFSPDKTTIHWKVGGTTTVKILTTFEVRIQYALHVGRMSFDVICLREARLADPFPNDPADQS